MSTEHRTVLVIDDDEATRSMVVAALSDEGYSIIGAQDGEDGMRLALDYSPRLILLDLHMPGGGRGFLEK